MHMDKLKQKMFRKEVVTKAIVAGIILVIILVIIVVVNMQESSQLYFEGASKSMPMLRNDIVKKLGDLYIELNRDFEKEMRDYELGYANRTNKRGDKIYYGINGKENPDELVNDDYVNGINITYVKGNGINRKDGESNFTDMMAFMSVALGMDIDKYEEDKLEEAFTKLFKLTHTYSGTSTELYPCTHGCAWCKYYCGDYMCQGELNGDTVGFYRCDEFMGQSGEYGLMYDPWLMTKESAYPELRLMAVDSSNMATSFSNKGENKVFTSGDGDIDIKEVKTNLRITNDDINIFDIMEIDGICEVCSGGETSFSSTTRKFAGCEQKLTCYHGHPLTETQEDGPTIIKSLQSMGSTLENDCTSYNAVSECVYVPPEDGESEESPHDCSDIPIGCGGYYECAGHEHFACPGHILVCCFGHTTLNLTVKIMYYQEMLETIKNLI